MAMDKSYEEAKAQLQNISKYRLEQENAVNKAIVEERANLDTRLLETYKQAQINAGVEADRKIAAVKEESLKKAAAKQQKEEQRYNKQKTKLEEQQKNAKTDAEKKEAKNALEALEKNHEAQLQRLDERTQKELDNAEKIAKRRESLQKFGKVGQTLDNVLSRNFGALISGISDFATSLKSEIDSIASYKTSIDTRLQGSKQSKWEGSYWDKISKDITGAAAISPLVKQSDIASKVQSMVNQGISYNVEQRAFLATISEKIASTFNDTNSSLARLVRIQQQDSTAARLGMESALTSFLNNMYETTEYMSDVMSSIRGSLEEAEALMSSTAATEFDYQVNKWLGSLYSVGMSDSAVRSIGTALGDLAAGKISGITSDGAGNLIVMAANNAGLSVADLLKDGLDDSSTNRLMMAMVQYLKGIYSDTSGSLVLQQQYADVFGMTAADLKALSNLSTADISNTANQNLSYSGMLSQLNMMANSMYSRTSTGEIMTNLTDNLKYTMAAGIANNLGLYFTYTMANMLDDLVNGIPLSGFTAAGTGATQMPTVADIMKTTTLAGSIISGIASMISAGGNGGITGSGLLKAFGIGSSNSVVRGTGSGLITTSGVSYSNSGYVGNASAGDVYEKSMTDQQESINSQIIEAQEESNEATTSDINNNILLMYQLLQDVTSGALSFKVDMGDSSAWSQVMNPNY